MMKTFFWYGFESGMRLSTAARGYDNRNEKISLTEAGQRLNPKVHLGMFYIRSSGDDPVKPANCSKAKTDERLSFLPVSGTYEDLCREASSLLRSIDI